MSGQWATGWGVGHLEQNVSVGGGRNPHLIIGVCGEVGVKVLRTESRDAHRSAVKLRVAVVVDIYTPASELGGRAVFDSIHFPGC